MSERTIWYIVSDMYSPKVEPFAVIRVDMSECHGDAVEGTVVSLHWEREEAERIVAEFNGAAAQHS